jgi:hypothetical protein
MTDIELLEMALADLQWAKIMIRVSGDDSSALDDSIAAIKERLALIIAEGCHPSHKTRISFDASSYDEICETCGATDGLGTWGELSKPCKADVLKD